MEAGNDTNIEAGDLAEVSCVEERYPAPEYAKKARSCVNFSRPVFIRRGAATARRSSSYWNKHDMPVYLPDTNGKVWNNDFAAAI